MIQITLQAANHIQELLSEKNSSSQEGLRLAIERGGCAGLQYVMTLGTAQELDLLVESHGAKVFVDAQSAEQLDHCTLDYEDGLTGRGFRILNPHAARSCGCGTSFEPQS